MQTKAESTWRAWPATLAAGAIAAAAIWLVAGTPELAAFGFVLAAIAGGSAPARGCLRRLSRSTG